MSVALGTSVAVKLHLVNAGSAQIVVNHPHMMPQHNHLGVIKVVTKHVHKT